MTAQPASRSAADRALSDPAALVSTATVATELAGHVTAPEITEFLRHLAELRVGARRDDPTKRAAFLALKTELFARIADQHARPAAGSPPPMTPMTPQGRTS